MCIVGLSIAGLKSHSQMVLARRFCKTARACWQLVVFGMLSIVATVAHGSSAEPNDVPGLKNGAKGTWESQGRRFDLIAELTIGVESQDPEYVLGKVTGIATDSQNNIFVLDYRYRHVQEYDSLGIFIRTIGHEGTGSGKFGYPTALTVGFGDTLYVADTGKVIAFDPLGRFVREISVGPPRAALSMVATESALFVSASDPISHYAIHKYNFKNGQTLSFCPTYVEADLAADHDAERLYGGGVLCLDRLGRVLYSRQLPYDISVFTQDGRLLSVSSPENNYKHLADAIDPLSQSILLNRLYVSYSIVPIAGNGFINTLSCPPITPADPRPTILELFDESGHLLFSNQRLTDVRLKHADRFGRLYGIAESGYPRVVRYRLAKL